MKPCVPAAVFLLLVCCMALRAHADLTAQINSILRDKSMARVQSGVEIMRLSRGLAGSTVIYRSNADVPLTPASNLKLITTSAALDRLGIDFKFRTQLVYHDGNLILIGDGDPSFGDAELLTRVGWDVTTVFQHWATQVKQLKLGPIKRVLVDDSIFDDEYLQPNWPANQWVNRYNAEVAGFNLNVNCLDVFLRPTQPGATVLCLINPPTHFAEIQNHCLTGEGHPSLTRENQARNDMILHGKSDIASDQPISITIHDPPMYAATVFSETLASAGVSISEAPQVDRGVRIAMKKAMAGGDRSWQVLAIHETPLVQVINRANKDSINLYGECLCKRLGAQATGEPGSWRNGTEAVAGFLNKIGISPSQYRLDDGCGLSRENLITAEAVARVLAYDYFSSGSKMMIDSLSVSGADGTLKNRFAGSNLRGRVLAKTGHIDGVSCLSGFLNARDGNCYVFSILMNDAMPGVGNPAQEKIVAAIDELKPE